MSPPFRKLAQPLISEDEVNEVAAYLRSGRWTAGPRCKQGETDLAELVGAKHARAAGSASTGLRPAIHQAMRDANDEPAIGTVHAAFGRPPG